MLVPFEPFDPLSHAQCSPLILRSATYQLLRPLFLCLVSDCAAIRRNGWDTFPKINKHLGHKVSQFPPRAIAAESDEKRISPSLLVPVKPSATVPSRSVVRRRAFLFYGWALKWGPARERTRPPGPDHLDLSLRTAAVKDS